MIHGLKRIIARLSLCIVLVGLFVGSVSLADNHVTLETFEAAGRSTHLLRYEDEYEDSARQILEEVSTIYLHYLGLFEPGEETGIFDVFIIVGGDPHPRGWLAEAVVARPSRFPESMVGDHTFSSARICAIQVHPAGADDFESLAFTLAHEFAHCFELVHILETTSDSSRLSNAIMWWYEGVAEWLAATVYPEDAKVAIAGGSGPDELIRMTRSGNNHTLTDTESSFEDGYDGYGSVYFWMYLNTIKSDAEMLDFVAALHSSATSDEAYQDYLAENLPDGAEESMNRLGLALAENKLAGQPPPGDLFEEGPVMDAVPGADIFNPNDFTLGFKSYSITADVEAVRVSLLEAPNDEARVHLSNGGDYLPLTVDSPVVFCKENAALEIRTVITQADGDGDSNFTMMFESGEDDEDCVEEPPPDESETEEGQSCLVGEWKLGNYVAQDIVAVFGPDFSESTVNIESIIFDVAESGQFTHTVNNFQVTMVVEGMQPTTVSINLVVSGVLDVSATGVGWYEVDTFDYSIDSFSAIATVEGMTLDVTGMLPDLQGQILRPPVRFECSAGEFLIYVIELNGEEVRWSYLPNEP